MRQRVVIIHRRSELDELLDRHNTRGQAEFFLKTRGRDLAEVDLAHQEQAAAIAHLRTWVPFDWAVAEVEREDLARFTFAPEDIVVVIGQDGLVANAAKYLTGQSVLGVNPQPAIIGGALVRFSIDQAEMAFLDLYEQKTLPSDDLAMVSATSDDGQQLCALNEIFLGHAGHQSARYLLNAGGVKEAQFSSGIIVASGAGATGWAASLAHDRGGRVLPCLTDSRLAWFVREAWPSKTTGVSLIDGFLDPGEYLVVEITSEELAAFGDGIETDRLRLVWGQRVEIGLAEQRLRLLRPSAE